MKNLVCCKRCNAKSKLLQLIGGIEWWRCTVPSCGYLFSAWFLRESPASGMVEFAVPPSAQPPVSQQETA